MKSSLQKNINTVIINYQKKKKKQSSVKLNSKRHTETLNERVRQKKKRQHKTREKGNTGIIAEEQTANTSNYSQSQHVRVAEIRNLSLTPIQITRTLCK